MLDWVMNGGILRTISDREVIDAFTYMFERGHDTSVIIAELTRRGLDF